MVLKYSTKRDAKRCTIRAELYPIIIGTSKVTEKQFDKLIVRFKRHKLYCGGDLT
jgi:hypothetical protein